ncbi:hypothetical protein [Olleya sp. HaHaR_3_96]|uniref:hypothetical protein n=1 Tax=Olleya sp. HaHaR_3_96 TaxID=2745560 RepID=UPI001C4F84CA|nr:hypothetical protein [Olleya sp. HaHaR_3_96]QXP61570.1 hypothetical protein H0I26_08050 [Olleya sp. HaHaR_3_96]
MTQILMRSEQFKKASNTAAPHSIVANTLVQIPITNIDNLAPAGAMSSSAKDMTNWLLAQINSVKLMTNKCCPLTVFKPLEPRHLF